MQWNLTWKFRLFSARTVRYLKPFFYSWVNRVNRVAIRYLTFVQYRVSFGIKRNRTEMNLSKQRFFCLPMIFSFRKLHTLVMAVVEPLPSRSKLMGTAMKLFSKPFQEILNSCWASRLLRWPLNVINNCSALELQLFYMHSHCVIFKILLFHFLTAGVGLACHRFKLTTQQAKFTSNYVFFT